MSWSFICHRSYHTISASLSLEVWGALREAKMTLPQTAINFGLSRKHWAFFLQLFFHVAETNRNKPPFLLNVILDMHQNKRQQILWLRRPPESTVWECHGTGSCQQDWKNRNSSLIAKQAVMWCIYLSIRICQVESCQKHSEVSIRGFMWIQFTMVCRIFASKVFPGITHGWLFFSRFAPELPWVIRLKWVQSGRRVPAGCPVRPVIQIVWMTWRNASLSGQVQIKEPRQEPLLIASSKWKSQWRGTGNRSWNRYSGIALKEIGAFGNVALKRSSFQTSDKLV